MLFSRLFKGGKKTDEDEANAQATVDQGMYYLYLIIGAQMAFVLGLVAIIMVVGKVMATPMWVFIATIGLGIWGLTYIYRKAKRQFHKLSEALHRVDLSDRNYQISFMGGFLTMRVEQGSHQHLLEGGHSASSPALLEGETIDTTVVGR